MCMRAFSTNLWKVFKDEYKQRDFGGEGPPKVVFVVVFILRVGAVFVPSLKQRNQPGDTVKAKNMPTKTHVRVCEQGNAIIE